MPEDHVDGRRAPNRRSAATPTDPISARAVGISRRSALAGSALAAALLGNAVLPQPAIAASADPSVVNTSTFYPEDFGARGDGVTNDTTAMQACLDAAVKAGGGTVQFGPKTYLLNSAPRHDRGGNAILALPYSLTSSGTLRLQGVAQATNLATTVSGQRFSPQFGCPSIVGGPSPEQLGRTGLFSFWNIELVDLNVLGPHNSTLCGVDLIRQVRCSVRNVYISTVNPTASRPTAAYGFGLRLPDGLNFARVSVEDVDVYGFYTGFVVNTAHTRVKHGIAKWCACGYGLTGSGQLMLRIRTPACSN
jgi:hypothetical protein